MAQNTTQCAHKLAFQCARAPMRARQHTSPNRIYTHTRAQAHARARSLKAQRHNALRLRAQMMLFTSLCVFYVFKFSSSESRTRGVPLHASVCVCVCAKSHTALHSITGPSSACASPLPLRPPALPPHTLQCAMQNGRNGAHFTESAQHVQHTQFNRSFSQTSHYSEKGLNIQHTHTHTQRNKTFA